MANKVRKTTMETYDVKKSNQRMRARTRIFAVSICKMLDAIKLNDLDTAKLLVKINRQH